MKRLVASVVIAVTATACVNTDPDPGPTTTRTIPPTTSTTTTTVAAGPDCLAGNLPFAEQGIVAALDSPQADATAVGGIRWIDEEECERVLIEFLAEGGSPATRLGAVGVTIARDSGIVRISLPEAVSASAIGDTLISGALVDRVYVVEGITEGLVIDVHLAAHAAVRAFTTNSPSRLILDVRPSSDTPLGSAPDTSGRVVVSSPLSGPGLYPLQVAGYAAPGVDAVQMTLSTDGTTALERTVSTIAAQHVWRAFALTISDGPPGAVELRVSAQNGSDEGVVVELDLP